MLGVALTAQRAGWALTEPNFISTSAVSTSWAAGWPDYISLTSQPWGSPVGGDNLTSTFDNSGITSGNKYIQVATIRLQAASNYTFQNDAFRSYQTINTGSGTVYGPFAMNISNGTTTIFNRGVPGKSITGNFFSWLIGWGTYEFIETAVTWDSLADRWITVIWAVSDSSTDFANYSASTPSGTATLIYNRLTVTDAGTGALIATNDFTARQFNTVFTDFANYTWAWRTNISSPATAFAAAVGTCNIAGAGDTNLLMAAGWAAAGDTIDPLGTDANGLQWREYFVGQNFPETVDGVRAWCNFTIESDTVDGSNLDVARMLPGRASTTDDLLFTVATASLDTPYTSTDRPGN